MNQYDEINPSKISLKELLLLLKQDVDSLKRGQDKILDIELRLRVVEEKVKQNNMFRNMAWGVISAIVTAILISHFKK